jgi:hypothetical protein
MKTNLEADQQAPTSTTGLNSLARIPRHGPDPWFSRYSFPVVLNNLAYGLVLCLLLPLGIPKIQAGSQSEDAPSTGKQMKGHYYGLIYSTNVVRPRSSGYFHIRVKANRGFSGRVFTYQGSFLYRGKFNKNFKSKTHIEFGHDEGRIFLHLNEQTGLITGHAEITSPKPYLSASVLGYRARIGDNKEPVMEAGDYTLLLTGQSDLWNHQGMGYAKLNISNKGKVSLVGTLSDGTKFSRSTAVCEFNNIPVYSRLKNRSGFIGSIFTDNKSGNTLEGFMYWLGPQRSIHPPIIVKFSEEWNWTGSRYSKPPSGSSILNWTEGLLIFESPQLDQALTNRVRLTLDNNVEVVSSSVNKLKMKILPSTGWFKGSFVHPNSRKNTKFSGAILQQQEVGGGVFRGHKQSGTVWLQEELK